MANRFEQAQAKYNDPNTSDFDKGVALATMRQAVKETDDYNRENNPRKYHEDKKDRALEKAEYHATEAKKYPEKEKPTKKGK